MIDETFATTGVILFQNVFTIKPDALDLFSFKETPYPNMIKHGIYVMKYIDKFIKELGKDQNENDFNSLNKLGKRHVGRGVKIPHFEVVGQALIKTLSDCLGPDFT